MQVESISREVNRAWLAGIFDGEGSMSAWFGAQYHMKHEKCQGRHLVIRVSIGSTDARIIKKVSEILMIEEVKFSYSLKHDKRSNRKPFLRIDSSGKSNVRKLLEITLPYVAKKGRNTKLLEIIDYRESLTEHYSLMNKDRRGKWAKINPSDLLENEPRLNLLIQELKEERKPIDPSETQRKASQILTGAKI